ncbi:GNAT family N-acetyltransferase [Luteibacter jiangsuensis]|uniref:GNAT family N-acetyltransferase n=1 Tax=Luteibacter jiangsuensis TaxID=637577 RepID=A0ABX0Q992_9GAMM|nr:GNAT family N-acetyltransferase [Luteibacter jiangsuensis]NID05773.1 GNAT family N-acetyltransferase [Luteibacter jiangsuensis]
MLTTISKHDLSESEDLLTALVKLNNDHAVELSWLDEDRLMTLIDRAFMAERAGPADAMLIAFDQAADYDSPNFLWFRARYSRFIYVDRVVTAQAARGRGLAKTLYRKLIDRAQAVGHDRILCEVNSDPPNPASDAFHYALGFRPVGTASLGNGKVVTYLELPLEHV